MSDNPKPETPDGWRELLRQAIREPELPEEAKNGRRRQRRRARKDARAAQRHRTQESIDAARRREPVTAGGAFLIIVVILAIGLGARWLGGGDDDETQAAPPAASASPTQEEIRPDTTTDPTPTETASAEDDEPDLSDPEQVAQQWARAYLTRNPPEDGDHTAAVDHASPWMSSALTVNLTEHDDRLWNELVSRGGISEVTEVTIGEADPELGIDTPLRIWRELTVTTDVEGYENYTDTHTLQVEVSQQTDATWLVTRVLGL